MRVWLSILRPSIKLHLAPYEPEHLLSQITHLGPGGLIRGSGGWQADEAIPQLRRKYKSKKKYFEIIIMNTSKN